jgi:hypothetical protein
LDCRVKPIGAGRHSSAGNDGGGMNVIGSVRRYST